MLYSLCMVEINYLRITDCPFWFKYFFFFLTKLFLEKKKKRCKSDGSSVEDKDSS